ncbi:cationic amino acid transporter 2 isoform X1 [Halyomorpha halys]|uniref:cationic amino acid transporter 2 isoform X1 n=1 Tax=Halyomorpha halys TaxID=286706 RepID=UPI0006D4E3BF|nr:cationic amino acid transporter 2 isoform X2 [Halyomorpha halys]
MVYHQEAIVRCLRSLPEVVSRKKQDEPSTGTLARVLGLMDLSLLGVGSTLGVGVYVLAGAVAKTDAGPAVTLSFMVAAFASALAGICYAEFAARVPKAGSAYVYSYVTVGELAAFVIGWNLILEYVIGTASVAKAFSNYLDVMMDYRMNNTLSGLLPLHYDFLAPYPDFLSLGIVLVLTGLLAYGVKESAWMNNLFTGLNLLTVIIVIVAGLFNMDVANWKIPKDQIPKDKNAGEGGFMPFGISGVMSGAAKCFFGFIGFDCVATTGEEAKNPQRHIPLAIVISLLVIFLCYFGISTVITMMVPYYLQNEDAPLVVAFRQVGFDTVGTIVSFGAVFALCTSLLGAVFPLPRILWAMSADGLLPKFLSYVSDYTQTPIVATVLSGIFAGVMSAIFKLDQLIDMMSIGTLLAYTIVSLCVLLLRYRDPKPALYEPKTIIKEKATFGQSLGLVVNYNRLSTPDKGTTQIAEVSTLLFCVMTFITTLWLAIFEDTIGNDSWSIYVFYLLLSLTCLPVIVMSLQPQHLPNLFFKVPLIPFLPCISIFINVYLMMKLDVHTWIRFSIWIILGGLIYIFYSIPHSVEGKRLKGSKEERNINMH